MSKKTVNIVNFVRGVEPREEKDLLTPVVEEIRLNKKYGFENTFLLQYDAMTRPDMAELFQREKDDHMELGIWIEMARELVEKAGIPWRSKRGWDWDWYVNPGFLLAYTREQKERIIDLIMEKFKELFGYYPKSAGSWVLDSDSIQYMTEKYGLEAFCICREQWATDAYTLWGGYYNGPYFPCKNNILNPAQTKAQQIHVPVIRMLGPDPIHCYYERVADYNKIGGLLYTLEPGWVCGRDEKWVNWYFRSFLEREDMGYNYTQTGQENSFGWDLIGQGLPMQMEFLNELVQEGKVTVEKLCDTGRHFTEQYEMTPATVYSALDDWSGNDCQSVWYSCKNYRLNLYCEDNKVYIRDLHKFDENYRDIYLDTPCEENDAVQDALPVMDGLRFSDKETKAGIYLGKGKILDTFRDADKFIARITADGKEILLILDEDRIELKCDSDFTAGFAVKTDCPQICGITEKQISYSHNGTEYALCLNQGTIADNALKSLDGRIEIILK